MRVQRLRWLSALALVTVAPLAASPGALAAGPSSTPPAACRVWNVATATASSDVQAAIDGATSGDTLRVRGLCAGHFRIDKDLRLTGPATLDGATCDETYCRSIVLVVNAGHVGLRHVRIVNGLSTWTGGGIQNAGTLTLSGSSSVTRNEAEDGGGGIYNEGTLIMTGSSSVTGNSLTYNGMGGGIYNVGTLIMDRRSSVTANAAQRGGGIYNEGTIFMNRWSSVTGNSAEIGGGILDAGAVRFSPQWRGTICGNDPDDWPGCPTCSHRPVR